MRLPQGPCPIRRRQFCHVRLTHRKVVDRLKLRKSMHQLVRIRQPVVNGREGRVPLNLGITDRPGLWLWGLALGAARR